MNNLNHDMFKQHEKTTFTLKDSGGIELQLDEVAHAGQAPEGFESFSLVFGSKNSRLEQATYTLQHPQMQEIDMFLVPISQQGDTTYYESVFNIKR